MHTGLQTGTTDFEHQTAHFSRDYKVILPDLRGHGKSVSEDLSNYFLDSADDLAETLEDLHIDSAHLVGCSLGSLISIFFAKKYPDKIKSLTLSGVTSGKPEKWEEMQASDVAHQTQLLQDKDAISLFDSMHVGDWKPFLYEARNPEWYPFEETKSLATLDMPILFMVGEGSPDEVETAKLYPETNKNVHVAVIPFAGHMVHQEQPEVYTRFLVEFLSKVKEFAYE